MIKSFSSEQLAKSKKRKKEKVKIFNSCSIYEYGFYEYEYDTPTLKTIEDYQNEINRAKRTIADGYYITEPPKPNTRIIVFSNVNCRRIGYNRYKIFLGRDQINFLTRRIKNCYIRISQLKQKRD